MLEVKKQHPDAEFLVHPECCQEVVALADYAGSTSGIIKYATESEKKEFIIGTENGVFYELKEKNPDKIFYPVSGGQLCPGMKSITLEKVRDCLKYETGEVFVEDRLREESRIPLGRMLEAGSR